MSAAPDIVWVMCDQHIGHLEELGIVNPYTLDAAGTFRYGREMPLRVLTDPRAHGGNHDPAQYSAHVTVRDGGWKYVWNRFEVDELYDLAADPAEMDNLAASPTCADQVAEMRRLIVAMLKRTGPGLYDWCEARLPNCRGRTR